MPEDAVTRNIVIKRNQTIILIFLNSIIILILKPYFIIDNSEQDI